MIHALHGNAGLPENLHPVLSGLGRPFDAWHLWRCLKEQPQCASLEGFGSMMNAATDSNPVAPCILFGYSLGARLALHALTQHPDKWDAAILVSPHPGLQSEEDRAARLRHDQQWAARFLHEPLGGVMSEWNAQPVLAESTVSHPDLESWRPQLAQALEVWSLGQQQDLRPRLQAITCPVLWITGARDEKFTALAAGACPLLPRGVHLTVPDAGHRVHLDQPETVIREVRAFLQTTGC